MEKGKNRIFKTAFLMVVITLSAKVLGMLRDILLASSYGTSSDAVAYDTASRLPLLIFDFVIGGVVTASFIPVFNEVSFKEGKEKAFDFANCFINAVLLLTSIITVIGFVFASPLVSVLAPSLEESTAVLAVSLTRIMFPMVIFTGLAYCFVGLLQSFDKFLLPALISLVSNLIMVLYFVFFNEEFGIYGLSVAMLCGWGSQALIQMPSVHKIGYRYKPTLNFSSPYIRKSLAMSLPILVSSWVQPFCNLINTRFASYFENGSAIPAVGYANRLYLIIVGVFTFVATNLLFPYLSKAQASGNKSEEKKLTGVSIKALALIIVPITVGIFVLSEPLVSVIYERNEFGANDVRMTAEALRFFALAMPFYAVNEVCTKKFFAEQKTVPPMITALVSILIDLLLAAVLSKHFGIAGIAISSSLAVLVNMFLNYFIRVKSGDEMLDRSDIFNCVKIFAAAILMGAVVFALRKILFGGILGLFLLTFAGAVSYFMLCLVFRESIVLGLTKKIIFGRNKK